MVLAQRDLYPVVQVPKQDKEQRRSRPRPAPTRKAGAVKFVLIFALCLWLAFLIVGREAHIAGLGYRLVELKDEIQQAETRNQGLELEIARHENLGRIEQVATGMGMVRPLEVRVAAAVATPDGALASQALVLTEPAGVSTARRTGIVARINSYLFSWLTGVSRAEANTPHR